MSLCHKVIPTLKVQDYGQMLGPDLSIGDLLQNGEKIAELHFRFRILVIDLPFQPHDDSKIVFFDLVYISCNRQSTVQNLRLYLPVRQGFIQPICVTHDLLNFLGVLLHEIDLVFQFRSHQKKPLVSLFMLFPGQKGMIAIDQYKREANQRGAHNRDRQQLQRMGLTGERAAAQKALHPI